MTSVRTIQGECAGAHKQKGPKFVAGYGQICFDYSFQQHFPLPPPLRCSVNKFRYIIALLVGNVLQTFVSLRLFLLERGVIYGKYFVFKVQAAFRLLYNIVHLLSLAVSSFWWWSLKMISQYVIIKSAILNFYSLFSWKVRKNLNRSETLENVKRRNNVKRY